MRVTRFMSRAEWDAFERGRTLVNKTDHYKSGRGGSLSVGFCFTEDDPAVAWEYLKGLVDADVWVTFDFPDGYLSQSEGRYADKSKDAAFGDVVYKREWCCTKYNKSIAKVVTKRVPFQGKQYRDIKKFIDNVKNGIRL